MDAAVLARDPFAVPVVCGTASHAQIWVTLPHGQVAGTLFSVALGLTSAAWEAVLAWKSFIYTDALKEDGLRAFLCKIYAAGWKDNGLCHLTEHIMIVINLKMLCNTRGTMAD